MNEALMDRVFQLWDEHCAHKLIKLYMQNRCDECGKELQVGEWPWCPHKSTTSRANFKAYDIDIDGTIHHIDSIQTADRIEREAERRFRNGEGAPIAFRAFHQDHSNLDRNVYGETKQPKPSGRGAVRDRDSTGTPIIGNLRDFLKGR